MPATLTSTPLPSLNSPEIYRHVNALRTINNVTNWFYLLREYLLLGAVIGLTLTFYFNRADWGLAWAWNVPVTLAAIVLIGAGQHRLTNTRVFLVGRLIQLAVFPLGMDWHLPHHLFPMVPHYRLRELHELLLGTQEYREHATVVEGYFFHRDATSVNPTVLDLMAALPA